MTELPSDLLSLAKDVLVAAKSKASKITTAESCTGGLIGGLLTAIPGSSTVIESGFLTYSNESKIRLLGVPRNAISDNGAVSDIVAAAMAEGAIAQANANIAISVTGIAGPSGGTKEKPVGLVFLALAQTDRDAVVKRYVFAGTRTDIRRASVAAALELLHSRLTES
ncbi:MAG: damage-inducible protein CinA [Candidatus Marinimicrobia bacterium]|nr:damage-inducible protein CinA [Candidatus Neomarinimicrobiota bacterium]|tara:strand:+ start:328 stop:828 length:501 start_codon:yes stop_codon:yes gene_type:complete